MKEEEEVITPVETEPFEESTSADQEPVKKTKKRPIDVQGVTEDEDNDKSFSADPKERALDMMNALKSYVKADLEGITRIYKNEGIVPALQSVVPENVTVTAAGVLILTILINIILQNPSIAEVLRNYILFHISKTIVYSAILPDYGVNPLSGFLIYSENVFLVSATHMDGCQFTKLWLWSAAA